MDNFMIYMTITISLNDRTGVSLFFRYKFWYLENFSGTHEYGNCYVL